MTLDHIRGTVDRFHLLTKNNTPVRFLNFLLIIFQHTVTKNSFVLGYPIELVVDPVDICNLHCPLCPTGQGRDGRSKGKMDFGDFKRIVDELGKYTYRIDLHNWGEPLLNSEIFRMISYARDNNIEVAISTNLNEIDRGKAEQLVRSGLNELIISLDGASQDVYQEYRVGGDFQNVTDGIRMIVAERRELGLSTPLITWQFLVMKHNEHEIDRAKQMAMDLGVDEFVLLPIHCDMGRELTWDYRMKTERSEKWLPDNLEYRLYEDKRKGVSNECNFLWVQSTINWNGSVSPCCAVYEEEYDFGNIFESGFMRIWNNDKYRASRRMARRRRLDVRDMKTICYYCIMNAAMFSTRNDKE